MRKFLVVVLIAAVLVLSGCTARSTSQPVPKPDSKFVVAGSGSNLPITGKLVEAYNNGQAEQVEMPASIGSSGGIRAVEKGAIELGLISRPLLEDEKKAGLKEVPYARVAIVIGVNPDVPDEDISYQDLVDIFQGKKKIWQNDATIIVLSREQGDSSNAVLEAKVKGFREALVQSLKNKRWEVVYTDAEEARAISNTPFSLGLSDSGALSASGRIKVKPLRVNGVAPTLENVKNASYKLYKDLYFIYTEPLSIRASRFLDFVFSVEGEKVISANGGIPLKR